MFFLLVFLFGISIGSFLNVVIYRLNHDDSVARGRSYCSKCKHPLGFFDLVPLLSFIFLRGKCRYCKKTISWQYPLVELAMGLTAIGLSIYPYAIAQGKQLPIITNYQLLITNLNIFLYLLLFIIFASFLVIFVSDLRYMTVPIPAIIAGILSSSLYIFLATPLLCLQNLLTGLGAFFFFFLLFLMTKGKGMGFGDGLIALVMGLFLGWQKTIISFYIAFLTGAFLGVILILLKKKKFGQQIAFGPLMIFGFIVAFVWGETIWQKIISRIIWGLP